MRMWCSWLSHKLAKLITRVQIPASALARVNFHSLKSCFLKILFFNFCNINMNAEKYFLSSFNTISISDVVVPDLPIHTNFNLHKSVYKFFQIAIYKIRERIKVDLVYFSIGELPSNLFFKFV